MRLETIKTLLSDPKYASLTDEEAMMALNTASIQSYAPVEYTNVASYMMVMGKYLAITESADPSAKTFMLAMKTFKTFDVSKPGVNIAINNVLDALIADGYIDATDKTNIMNMTLGPMVTPAEEAGVPGVTLGEVTKARTM